MLLSLYLVKRAVALMVSRCSLAIKQLFFYFGVLYPTSGTLSMPLFPRIAQRDVTCSKQA
jgi:hypothetical protein